MYQTKSQETEEICYFWQPNFFWKKISERSTVLSDEEQDAHVQFHF